MLNLSIHPRNWPNTGNGEKKNTSKPPKEKAGRKRIAKFDRRAAGFHSLSAAKQAARTCPGSRNMHKQG